MSEVERLLKGDAGYISAEKRGQMKAMEEGLLKEVTMELETLKARFRARVEHPFCVVKRPFGCQNMRFKRLLKSIVQVVALFALSNLWMMAVIWRSQYAE